MKMSQYLVRALLAVVLLIVGLYLTDGLIGRWVLWQLDSHWLIFEPHAEFEHVTSEFDVTVRSNNLGIRGEDTDIVSKHAFRILAFGDSFTYGFGVEAEEAWPAQLEQILRREGLDAEVLNLGKPGAWPQWYATLATVAVPLLQPDLVLIGLTEGDDIAGSDEDNCQLLRPREDLRPDYTSRLMQIGWRYVQHWALVANALSAPAAPIKASRMQSEEQRRARAFIEDAPPEAQERFVALDPEIQEAYLSGNINPYLVKLSCTNPEFFSAAVKYPEDAARRAEGMARCIEAIQEISAREGAAAVVVSIPHCAYMNAASMANVAQIGFDAPPAMLASDLPDKWNRDACETAGVPCVSVHEAFQGLPDVEQLYYPWDLHFNAAGHHAFATLIADGLDAYLPN